MAANQGFVDMRIIANSYSALLMKMKFGRIGFIMAGISISLMALLNALKMIPGGLQWLPRKKSSGF